MDTPRLGLPEIQAAQAQKHVTHNAALAILDALVQASVINRTTTGAPVSPSAGDSYIVAAPATGAWSGQEDNLATWDGTTWIFVPPARGMIAFDQSAANLLVFNVTWGPLTVSGDFSGETVLASRLGIGGASPDATNKLAFYGTNMLFNSGGSIDATFNKSAPSNDASFSYKTGFSVRALAGLLGNDDYSVKVSPNGATFFEAIRVDRNTGRVSFPSGTAGPAICQLRNNDTTTNINTPALTDIPLNGVEDMRDAAVFERSGNGAKCLRAGRVKVTASVYTETVATQRAQVAIRVAINGTAINGTGSSSYMRATKSYRGTSYISLWVDVAVNDVVTIQGIADAQAGTDVTMIDGQSVLTLEQF